MAVIEAQKGPPIKTGETGIFWAALAMPTRLMFSGTSQTAVSHALKSTFGEFPIRLVKDKHLPVIEGMANVIEEGRQPWEQLIKALSHFGELELVEQ